MPRLSLARKERTTPRMKGREEGYLEKKKGRIPKMDTKKGRKEGCQGRKKKGRKDTKDERKGGRIPKKGRKEGCQGWTSWKGTR